MDAGKECLAASEKVVRISRHHRQLVGDPGTIYTLGDDMNRNRWILTVFIALLVIWVGVWGTFFRGHSPNDCKPVVEMLEFNDAQGKLIAEKTGDETGSVPSFSEILAYQQWADGLTERAQQVTNPELLAQAVQLADLSTQFVAKLPSVRAASENRAPGAPAPPVAFEMSVLNDRITAQTEALAKACVR